VVDAGVNSHLIGDCAQCPLECLSGGTRDDEQIDVFGESFDQVVRLGQAGAALEDDAVDAVIV